MSNRISIVMGSYSDWETMKNTAAFLDEFGVKYDKAVISAHRIPEEMMAFAKDAVDNGIEVIIAGAGG
ncbi:MAG: AIR carboxylase family protein, partial [Ligilactobacillus sp.]|nr:AIR carboxylase family protein [Ligilactobacillus sp.]